MSVKLEAISYAAQHSLSAAAAKYHVDRKSIRRWRAKKEKSSRPIRRDFVAMEEVENQSFPSWKSSFSSFFKVADRVN